MLILGVWALSVLAVVVLLGRVHSRPATVFDLMCSQVDDELAGRVVRERVAA